AESNNTFGTAYNLGTIEGKAVEGDLAISTSSDADWFKFTTTTAAVHGTYVQVEADHTQGQLGFSLYNSSGQLLGNPVGTLDVGRISLDGYPAGTYYVGIGGSGGATNPNYTLTIQAPTALHADWSEPQSMYHLRTVQGEQTWTGLSLDTTSDTDWFDFQLPQQ